MKKRKSLKITCAKGIKLQITLYREYCLLLRRFDFSRKAGEAGELEAREGTR